MKLSYDNVSRKTNNTPGVEVRLPEWGKTDDLEWVDSTPIADRYDFGAYFYYIAQALDQRGYVRGQMMFGAPYDFRKGPSTWRSVNWNIKYRLSREKLSKNTYRKHHF